MTNKTENNFTKAGICLIILLQLTVSIFAQKVPNKQEISLRLPKDVKIDGKANEWAGQFQAYNHATEIFYSVANDDSNLYFVIKATKPRIVEKIIDGGISFIVSDAAKKNVSITYPNIDIANRQRIIVSAGKKAKSNVAIPAAAAAAMPIDTNDREALTHTDSLIAVANSLLANNAKTVITQNISGQNDTLSVYNEQGIRVASKFDKDGNYACELAIPLRYIDLTQDSHSLKYSIRLNGRLASHQKGTHIKYVYIGGHATDIDADLDSATDFWGEYTLAKKP